MLKILRDHTKIIVWSVVIIFAIFGGYQISSLKKEGRFAGEVFGKTVTFQEFNLFYNATRIFMPTKEPVQDPDLLRGFTWQNIIYAKEAKREGIKVTDEEVRREIQNLLAQQGLENASPETYKIWLTRNLRMTTREFEEGLREFIRIQKLLRAKVKEIETAVPLAEVKPEPKQETKTSSKSGKTKKEAAPKSPKPQEDPNRFRHEAFMQWTNDLNRKAKFRDYLALPAPAPELPEEQPKKK